jgi:hypothetical protein
MELTRRSVLSSCAVVTTAGLAGCSVFADAKRSVVVTVLDASSASHTFTITISQESEIIARQYLQTRREPLPYDRPSAQTELQVGRYPKDTELTVTVESEGGFETTEQLALDCKPEADANSVTIRVRPDDEIQVSADDGANTCYTDSALVFSENGTNTEVQ